jgi:hypothetical protein
MLAVRILGLVAFMALVGCTPDPLPDYPAPATSTGAVAPLFTMSWLQPREFSEDWSLPITWEAHRRACPHDGKDFSVKHFQQSPEDSPTELLITFRCDDGTLAPVKVFLQSRDALRPGSSEGLTLHIDQPPSSGVDGGQEVIMFVQQKACPGDTDKAGSRFSFKTRARSESSWAAVVTCTDGSRHTVIIVWD